MNIDPDNPVVRLCVKGMQAEGEGRLEEARDLFMRAWAARRDDFEACVAAHFVARHQDNLEDLLRWNLEAFDRAEAVGDERVRGFYPSLYLNLGWSYEVLGDRTEAGKYYALATTRMDDLPAGPYRDVVEKGITEGRKRMGESEERGVI